MLALGLQPPASLELFILRLVGIEGGVGPEMSKPLSSSGTGDFCWWKGREGGIGEGHPPPTFAAANFSCSGSCKDEIILVRVIFLCLLEMAWVSFRWVTLCMLWGLKVMEVVN